jgi:thiol-disulfide isomerase/thioredoxin
MNLSATFALMLALGAGAQGQSKLELMSTGAMSKIGFYRPIALTLTDARPEGLAGGPTGPGVLYGTIHFGERGKQFNYVVALQDTDESNAVLYLDRNHDGSLTDDEKIAWKTDKRQIPTGNGTSYESVTFSGQAALDLDGKSFGLGMYRFSRADEARRNFKGQRILYYRDYALFGKVKVGKKSYDAILTDDSVTGDFSLSGPDDKHLTLLFDLNGNGKFGERGEQFDTSQAFNVGGTTYEVAAITPSGDAITIKKSKRVVAETKAPPSFALGSKVPSFKATGLDGKPVSFPGDYKGKVVLVDFWATWCGPCVGEIPNVVAAYGKYHEKGLEILGISLDQEKAEKKLKDFTAEKKMPWQQIYDGKYWKAEIAVLYGIESIPHMFLIDGSSGKVIQHGDAIRGEKLAPEIEKALAAKRR